MLESHVKLDNVLIWQSGVKPFYEVYYLKINDPLGTWSFWARYTLCTSAPGHPAGVASIWAVFTDASGKKISAKEDFDLLTYDIHHTDRFIQIGDSFLSLAEASGVANRDKMHLKWDLTFEDPVQSLRLYPNPLFYQFALPRTKFVEPRLSGFVTGTLYINDRKINLLRTKVHQAHIYGTGYANDWAWTNCIDFAEEPEAWFEALSARIPLGKRLSPYLTLACLQYDGRIYRANSIPKMIFGNRSKHDFVGWELSFSSAWHRFQVHITRDPQLIAGVRYDGPNGEERFCYNTMMCDIEIRIEKLSARGWRQERALTAKKKCAFETASPHTNPEVPLIF